MGESLTDILYIDLIPSGRSFMQLKNKRRPNTENSCICFSLRTSLELKLVNSSSHALIQVFAIYTTCLQLKY